MWSLWKRGWTTPAGRQSKSDDDWNDEIREELRETLQSAVCGQLRLGKYDSQGILEYCRDVYLEDDCPEEDLHSFLTFIEAEIGRKADEIAAEMVNWPKETDCDRLDRVEEVLRQKGILLWQVSPCCDTCTISRIPDRIERIDQRLPGFSKRVRGYAFFIDQNMSQNLADQTEISAYLSYGWFSPEQQEVDPASYQSKALEIAREVCECLRSEGFEVDWNGTMNRKIGITLNWQRRSLLR